MENIKMRTFKITLTEDELKALIDHHCCSYDERYTVEQSSRIHDLTKRLNKASDETSTEQTTEQKQPVVEEWN